MKTQPNKSFLTNFYKKIRFQLKLLQILPTSKITIKNKIPIFLQILFIINIKMSINFLKCTRKKQKKSFNNVHLIQKFLLRILNVIMTQNNFTSSKLNALKKLQTKFNRWEKWLSVKKKSKTHSSLSFLNKLLTLLKGEPIKIFMRDFIIKKSKLKKRRNVKMSWNNARLLGKNLKTR